MTVKTWIRKTVSVGVLAIGLVAVSAGAANADMMTDGNSGLLTGNNVSIPVNLNLNACGNGIGVLGLGIGASDSCTTGG